MSHAVISRRSCKVKKTLLHGCENIKLIFTRIENCSSCLNIFLWLCVTVFDVTIRRMVARVSVIRL